MKAKASLHIHTSEDPHEGRAIGYSILDLVDYASDRGFKVLALTPHRKFVWKKPWSKYAKKRGVLLLPGVEKEFKLGARRESHVLILNCDERVNRIKTLDELRQYKQEMPDLIVIPAHPNSYFYFSMGLKNVAKYKELFDAVEHTWFYNHRFNANKKTDKAARSLGLPLVATADLHPFNMKYFDTDYTELEVEELTPAAVKRAIVKKNFENKTKAKPFWVYFYMVYYAIIFSTRLTYYKIFAKSK